MTDIEKLQAQIKHMKKRSNARKRHLRDMNNKLKLYMAIADSAISDAARWKIEREYWKLKYETLLKEQANAGQA